MLQAKPGRSGKQEQQQQTLGPPSSRALDLFDVVTISTTGTCNNRARYPHLTIADIRGNLNTRLRKLDEDEGGKYSALVLAAAGVTRMKWTDRISQVKETDGMD